ncbi:MAG: hypothetical protein LC790_12230, partial [Actinobacteria bacterium]|nr:hypothetical protein [Actinomycetota bacterium]
MTSLLTCGTDARGSSPPRRHAAPFHAHQLLPVLVQTGTLVSCRAPLRLRQSDSAAGSAPRGAPLSRLSKEETQTAHLDGFPERMRVVRVRHAWEG